MKLITFCGNAVRVVNERLITALSKNPSYFTVVASASLLIFGFDPYILVEIANERDHFKMD